MIEDLSRQTASKFDDVTARFAAAAVALVVGDEPQFLTIEEARRRSELVEDMLEKRFTSPDEFLSDGDWRNRAAWKRYMIRLCEQATALLKENP